MSEYRRFVKRCASGTADVILSASAAVESVSRSLSDLAFDVREALGATARLADLLDRHKAMSHEMEKYRTAFFEAEKEREKNYAIYHEIQQDREAKRRIESEWATKVENAKKESDAVLSNTIRTLLVHAISSDLKIESDLEFEHRIALAVRVFDSRLAEALGAKPGRIVTIYRHDLSGKRYQITLPGGEVLMLPEAGAAR